MLIKGALGSARDELAAPEFDVAGFYRRLQSNLQTDLTLHLGRRVKPFEVPSEAAVHDALSSPFKLRHDRRGAVVVRLAELRRLADVLDGRLPDPFSFALRPAASVRPETIGFMQVAAGRDWPLCGVTLERHPISTQVAESADPLGDLRTNKWELDFVRAELNDLGRAGSKTLPAPEANDFASVCTDLRALEDEVVDFARQLRRPSLDAFTLTVAERRFWVGTAWAEATGRAQRMLDGDWAASAGGLIRVGTQIDRLDAPHRKALTWEEMLADASIIFVAAPVNLGRSPANVGDKMLTIE